MNEMGMVPTAYLGEASLCASPPRDRRARARCAEFLATLASSTRALRARSYRVTKRWFDLVFAAAALVVLAPVMVLIGLAIRAEGRGPVLFSQERVGRGGRRFRIYKFRSMIVDAETNYVELRGRSDDGGDVRFKMRSDPRLTLVGRVLRRFSLDELPQFWNVLRGEMSMVGPRPPLPCEVLKYDAGARRRLRVKPGLTCIWQVSGRADLPFDRQVELDLDYIRQQSVVLDLWLMARTVPAVLSGRGAY